MKDPYTRIDHARLAAFLDHVDDFRQFAAHVARRLREKDR